MNMTFRKLVALLAVVLLPLAVQAEETTTYYVNDLLGSPVAAIDEQGNVLWTETYAPYGARIEESPANPGNPAYTGKPEDPVTGLVYMGARWYDPETGRFASVDPVRFVDSNVHSFNRYAYANNSPYVFVDPDGNDAILAVYHGAANFLGHMTLFFQDERKRWYSYDLQATEEAYRSQMEEIKAGKWVQGSVAIRELPADWEKPQSGLAVTTFYYETTEAQDKLIGLTAKIQEQWFSDGYEFYNLYKFNCKDSAVMNLTVAGVDVDSPRTPIPNIWALMSDDSDNE
jgi:RHS repeat-associated protein